MMGRGCLGLMDLNTNAMEASAEMCNRSVEVPKKVSRATASRGFVKVAESRSTGRHTANAMYRALHGALLAPIFFL
jgi:hypothetical protein